jgi:hypothetical protein
MTMAALAQVVADSLTDQKLPDNWLTPEARCKQANERGCSLRRCIDRRLPFQGANKPQSPHQVFSVYNVRANVSLQDQTLSSLTGPEEARLGGVFRQAGLVSSEKPRRHVQFDSRSERFRVLPEAGQLVS